MKDLIYTVIVADDESVQKRVLKKIIEKICPEAEVIACDNGQEVYEILKQKHAEIVFTDICMPCMDGMQLIQRVSMEFPETRLVLVSAYQSFDYAHQAIRCEVKDYLIKPFQISDVEHIINKIRKELKFEKEQEENIFQIREFKDALHLEECCKVLLELLQQRPDYNKLQWKEFDCLRQKGVLVKLKYKSALHRDGNPSHHQQKVFKEIVKKVFPEGFLLISQKENILFLPEQGELSERRRLLEVKDRMQCHQIILYGGISERQDNLLDQAVTAYSQAEEALEMKFYMQNLGMFYFYDEIKQVFKQPVPNISFYEKKLQQAIRKREVASVLEILEAIREIFETPPICYPNKVKHQVSSIVIASLKEAEGTINQESFNQFLNDVYGWYWRCESFEELFKISQRVCKQLLEMQEIEIIFDPIEKAISYIKAHLSEEISLKMVAEQIYFNPSYLSSQFKNRLGISYSKFLLDLRMEKARHLLKETSHPIQEIAVKCGFSNSSYFIKVFHKEYKMSPEQYRRNWNNGK